MFEAARRRSSTASTSPTAPTTSAAAVAVAATATRAVIPTTVTVPTPRKRKGLESPPRMSRQTRRSRPHMCVCRPWPCAALSKVHNRSPATLP
jgi:hypothetical protein